MIRWFTGVLVLVIVTIFPVLTLAAKSPLRLTHALTGSSRSSTTQTLRYSLQVLNPGETPLGDIWLTLVSHPPFVVKETSLKVGYLAPHESTVIPLQVVTPLHQNPSKLARMPLYWRGQCLGANHRLMKFPARSVQDLSKEPQSMQGSID